MITLLLLVNHVQALVSINLFTVPTARLRVFFVLVVIGHHRRRVVHFNVTERPTADWTAHPQKVAVWSPAGRQPPDVDTPQVG